MEQVIEVQVSLRDQIHCAEPDVSATLGGVEDRAGRQRDLPAAGVAPRFEITMLAMLSRVSRCSTSTSWASILTPQRSSRNDTSFRLASESRTPSENSSVASVRVSGSSPGRN